jgi:hypothetical protein
MTRERSRNDERNRIAQIAARIMVEDGIENYATAKRKAARQAGVPETRQLPTNDEIDAAVRIHQSLFEADSHRQRLLALRTRAIDLMRDFDQFNPYLTGSVLSGSAGKYADINLQLYTDNPKAVELYLIDRGVGYKAKQCRLFCGTTARVVPAFLIDNDGVELELVVLDPADLRQPVRTTPDGKPMERARLHAVEVLRETT